MTHYEFNGESFYIDDRLKRELEDKIFLDLKKKDKDAVFIVDGKERAGKSVFAMQLGGLAASCFKTEFNLTNICMTPEEFRHKTENASKNQVIIYDEAHRGMASAGALREINKILKDLMIEMGQKNLLVIIVLPSIFLLDKYTALFRATGLFHIYENRRRRGFWVYYNYNRKLKLYLKGKKEFNYNCMRYPYFRGRFLNKYAVIEEEYRAKKAKSFKSKPRLTKAEVYINQRNLFTLIIHKEFGLTSEKIATMYKFHNKYGFQSLKATTIRDIWAKLKEKEGY